MAQDSPGARVGRRVRALRGERFLSQVELAKDAGVSKPTIEKLEQGSIPHPRRTTLGKLAGALGVELEDLIGQPRLFPLVDEPPPELWPLSLARLIQREDDEAARVRDLEGASPQELSHLLRDIERQRAIAGREVVRAEPGDKEDWRIYLKRLEELREEVEPYVTGQPQAEEMAATLASGAA